MNELTFAASVAWAVPLVISLLKNRSWPAVVKVGLSVIAALSIATAGLLISGEVVLDDVGALIGAAGLAFAEAYIVYRLILRGTGLDDRLTDAIWGVPPGGGPGTGTPVDPGKYRAFEVEELPSPDDVPPEERPPL